MAQHNTQPPAFTPSYFGPRLPNKPGSPGYKPLSSSTYNFSAPCGPIPSLRIAYKLGYWELLSPAIFGTGIAYFLSLFSGEEKKDKLPQATGKLFKFALIVYTIGAMFGVYYAIVKVVNDSRPPYNNLFRPIAGALVITIVYFSAQYLLLYRYFPSSFNGEVGDDFCTQLFSFAYLSATTIATADLGDITPANVTSRALIALEIVFYLFTLATAVPLLLAQKD